MLNQMPAVESVQINRIENHDKVFATTESGQEIELHITDQQKKGPPLLGIPHQYPPR